MTVRPYHSEARTDAPIVFAPEVRVLLELPIDVLLDGGLDQPVYGGMPVHDLVEDIKISPLLRR